MSLGLKVSRLRLYQELVHLEVRIFSSLYEGQPFCCIQTSADWTRITTIKRIHFTESTDSNGNIIEKHPHKYT